ncbi:MAG: exonuclease SbcCD subunit D [Paenirhodobacter sp.]|uniref:metallophosphoesterase family protein n=1 Tax=Paenirhodobacter sp. TaxID=1965326 RepID=UPI003D0BF4ED
MIRVLHASDLHLGKPFGGFPEEVRGALRAARQEAIGRLAAAARAGGASHVLLAGDSFDAETPAPRVLRHAMNAMAEADDLTWVLMPGNHDHLGAAEIWTPLRREAPANVRLALDPVAMELMPGVALLPAPCTTRNPGRDLTEWMDGADTGAAIRIGLGHGSIRDFRAVEEMGGEGSAVIAPDRAARAGLDYLGLGDWHGRIEIAPNCWYSGTPEADNFKPQRPAGALLVAIAGPGAAAEVREVETGQYDWRRLELSLLDGEDGAQALAAALPGRGQRARCLLDLRVQGRMSLAGHAALVAELARVEPDFFWFSQGFEGLALSRSAEDLARIDLRGAVHDAAESLSAAADAGDAEAGAALARLYAYAMETE